MLELVLVIIIIALALIFDFGNGFNDAANSISTVVATRVLSLRNAVILAAFSNFIAAFIFGVAVATTIGKGIIDSSVVTLWIIFSGLIGAIVWVYLTTFLGLPISASHSLIGGYIGSALAAVGISAVMWGGVLKIVLFIFLAPIVGFATAFVLFILVLFFVHKTHPSKVNNYFKKLQLISVFAYSLSHGTNDAQKTMGIIAITLFTAGLLGATFHVPFWVVIVSHLTIALGTLAGGKKVVKTIGLKITKLNPIYGFCAETAGAGTIIISSIMGVPVSTTHVISGSIIGVGATRRVSAIRWRIARKMLLAWLFTIPTSALIGAITYLIISVFI
ncbi:inorganic phosphate transporter [Candidatus Pacearchaeota archaeon]|nr:inorganic phosphate transporter [Candidatus Pacearchaeota archaeon]